MVTADRQDRPAADTPIPTITADRADRPLPEDTPIPTITADRADRPLPADTPTPTITADRPLPAADPGRARDAARPAAVIRVTKADTAPAVLQENPIRTGYIAPPAVLRVTKADTAPAVLQENPIRTGYIAPPATKFPVRLTTLLLWAGM